LKVRQLVEAQRSRSVVVTVADEDRQLRQELRQLQDQLLRC